MDDPARAQTSATLPQALTCARCGYDLRGLPLDQRCPECGETIAASIAAAQRWPLPRADRRWLRQTVMTPLLLLLGLVLWNSYVWWPSYPSTPPSQDFYKQAAVQLIILTAPLWCWLACWRLGAREPGVSPQMDPRRLRLILRVLASAYLGLFAATLAAHGMKTGWSREWGPEIFLAVVLALLTHLRLAQLARRAAHPWLARLHELSGLLLPSLCLLRIAYMCAVAGRTADLAPGNALPGWGSQLLTRYWRRLLSDPHPWEPLWWSYVAEGALVVVMVVLLLLAVGWLLSASYRRR